MRRVLNAAKMNHMEIENSKSLMEMGMLIQKLSKGRRKYRVKLSKGSLKLLHKTLLEMKMMMSRDGVPMKNFDDFINYLHTDSKRNSEILFSFDEISFLKTLISLTLQQQKNVEYKWYQLHLKFMSKILLTQCKTILEELKI